MADLDDGPSTRRAIRDALREDGEHSRGELIGQLTPEGHGVTDIDEALSQLERDGEIYQPGEGQYRLTELIADGGEKLGPALVDDRPVDVVWLHEPERVADPFNDTYKGEGMIVARGGDGGTAFSGEWLHLTGIDGTTRSIPTRRVYEVRRSVTEEYLQEVR